MGPLAHAGLAAASSIGGYVNLVALLWVARRRLGPLGGRALLVSALRTLAACVPLALWCWGALAFWPARPALTRELLWLAGAVTGGVALFWGASVALGMSERTALLAMLPRRGRREPRA